MNIYSKQYPDRVFVNHEGSCEAEMAWALGTLESKCCMCLKMISKEATFYHGRCLQTMHLANLGKLIKRSNFTSAGMLILNSMFGMGTYDKVSVQIFAAPLVIDGTEYSVAEMNQHAFEMLRIAEPEIWWLTMVDLQAIFNERVMPKVSPELRKFLKLRSETL